MNNLGRRLLNKVLDILSAIFNIGIRLKYVLPLLLIILFGTYYYTYNKMLDEVGGKADFDEAMRYIEIKDICDDRFIDEIDRQKMGESAARAMISGLGDAWSYYMSEDEYKTYQINSSAEYADIGMAITRDEAGNGYRVVTVSADSPIAWSGLQSGSVISSVDGEKIKDMAEDEVRVLIRSKLNSVFTLGVDNDSYTVTVDCKSSYVSPVNSRMEKTGAGYVQIYSFEAGSGSDAVNAIEELLKQGATALCIDLRGNPGGLKSEVTLLLDHLLPSGVLFYERDKDGNMTPTESEGMCVQVPMCVLINTETYAEAELCAAVLQEYGWASLLGEPTKGNTRTQETIVLSDGSAIRLSTASYITPNGVDLTAKGGVVPETIVINADASATGTTAGTTGATDGTASVSNDDQLMRALKLLS